MKSIPLLTESGTKRDKHLTVVFICFVIYKKKLKGEQQTQGKGSLFT